MFMIPVAVTFRCKLQQEFVVYLFLWFSISQNVVIPQAKEVVRYTFIYGWHKVLRKAHERNWLNDANSKSLWWGYLYRVMCSDEEKMAVYRSRQACTDFIGREAKVERAWFVLGKWEILKHVVCVAILKILFVFDLIFCPTLAWLGHPRRI